MGQVDKVFGLGRLTGARVGHAYQFCRCPTPTLLTVAQHDYRELAAVFVGGALGALARAALSSAVVHDPASWPWPTFIVNIVGAILVGYFTTRLLERLPVSSYRRPLLGTGFCGGLTTFSAMQVETLAMIDHGHWVMAATYTTSSIALGLLAVYLTTALVRRVRVRP